MKHIILATILLLLTACSPKYIVKTHYLAPITKQGKVCIDKCEKQRDTCQKKCDSKYDICLIKAKKHAQDNLPRELREYDRAMQDYYYDMDKYNADMNRWRDKEDILKNDYGHFKARCESDKDSYSCRRAKEINSELSNMFFSKPTHEPSRPQKPTLSAEIKKFQKNCSRKCGCTKAYDRCFTVCGGKIRHQKICVENCR